MFEVTSELSQMIQSSALPFFRIGALLMVAPVFGAALVPARVRVLLALALAAVLVPLMPAAPSMSDVLQSRGVVLIAQELVIGAAMGLVLQMVFDAVIIGSQTVAMSMGLGFAVMVDPQRGVNVPILSQFFLIVATLIFLAMDGHLMMIKLLAQSFETLPPGAAGIGAEGLWLLVGFGSRMFTGAVQIALPALTALLIVHIAFGVVSRAAPTLNLFTVGFPVTLMLGFVILQFSFGNMLSSLSSMFEEAFRTIALIVAPEV